MRTILAIATIALVSLGVGTRAQQTAYPQTVIPIAKGPFSFPAGYQTPWEKIDIRVTEKMSPNLFVLHGTQALDSAHPDASGGRAMALFGPDGVLMVDSQNRQVTDRTLAAIRSFTDGPIKVLVNTHVHSDHTGGNAFFAGQGAVIYAQENLRNEMIRPPGRPAAAGAAATVPGAPTVTYKYDPAKPGEPAVTLYMNGEVIDFIPMMPSHTAGDTIVRFRNADVIYIEDFYRNFGYPFADQANGGSLRGMLDAADLIAQLAGPNTTLVPGHGLLDQEAGSPAVPGDGGRRLHEGEGAARPGTNVAAGAGREPDGALRRHHAGRYAAEQGSLHRRGVRRSGGAAAGRRRQARDAGALINPRARVARRACRDRRDSLEARSGAHDSG
ncbi:MAG: MBL fold metallo-hydrolase [Vicinamibacterales bacterium]